MTDTALPSLRAKFNRAGKTILLFGGSFNPPHDGHFETASFLSRLVHPDEIWMLFSLNALKDPALYAPLPQRMEMGRIMAAHYPGVPLVMTDIEDRLGIHKTYYLLKELQRLHPDDRFVWVMGADGLLELDRWAQGERILEEFPVIVIDRPPYTDAALTSPLTQKHAGLRCASLDEILAKGRGWMLTGDPGLQSAFSSSRELRQKIAAGETDFPGYFAEVADYIRAQGLYGCPPPQYPSPGVGAPHP